MLISEAKTLVGQIVNLTYTDRSGREYTEQTEIFDVAFVPLYGPCMLTDIGELRLDRILNYELTHQLQAKAA